jgi:hypothetical protein
MPLNGTGALSGAASGAAAGAVLGPWGAAIGGVVGGVAGLFSPGQKAPQVAPFTPVDPTAVAGQAINGNLQNFGAASRLATQTNNFNQSEASRLLEKAIPGFGAIRDKLLASVNSDLDNQNNLPQDVTDQISRFAAEKGITRGTAGSGFDSFNLVKDFGYNLVDYKNAQRARALNTLSTVYGMTPRVNPMSPMSSFIDTNTAIGVAGANNRGAQDTTQAGYNATAAAGNYRASQIQGAITTGLGAAFSAYKDANGYGIQSKVLSNTPQGGPTMSPYVVKG